MSSRLTLLLLVIATVLGALGGGTLRGLRADRDMAALAKRHAEAVAVAAQDAQRRESETRTRERRVAFNIMEKADAANLKAAELRTAADRSRRAQRELLDAYTAVAAALGRAGDGTAAASPGSPATAAGLVLADVFGWCSARLQSCAAALDESWIAGRLCEQSYDAVTPPANSTP